jgi:hypothetical protein
MTNARITEQLDCGRLSQARNGRADLLLSGRA